MDSVNKGHNVSAVMRTCDAVGVWEVHAVWQQHLAEVYHSHAGGAAKWVGLRLHSDTPAALCVLKEQGYKIVGADPDPEAVDFREVDFTGAVAVVMGAEKYGLSQNARLFLDQAISIPMMGLGSSLNVSVAAGLILYEAQRQRALAGMYTDRMEEGPFRRTLFEWCYPELATYCREKGLDYPPLGPEGAVLGDIDGQDPEILGAQLRKS